MVLLLLIFSRLYIILCVNDSLKGQRRALCIAFATRWAFIGCVKPFSCFSLRCKRRLASLHSFSPAAATFRADEFDKLLTVSVSALYSFCLLHSFLPKFWLSGQHSEVKTATKQATSSLFVSLFDGGPWCSRHKKITKSQMVFATSDRMATGEDGKAVSCHSQSEGGKNKRVLQGRAVIPQRFFVFLFTLKPKQLPDRFLLIPPNLPPPPRPLPPSHEPRSFAA